MDVLFTVMRLVRASISSRLMFILFSTFLSSHSGNNLLHYLQTQICYRIHCLLKFFKTAFDSVTHTFYQHAWHLISIRGKYDSRSLHFTDIRIKHFMHFYFLLGICNKFVSRSTDYGH